MFLYFLNFLKNQEEIMLISADQIKSTYGNNNLTQNLSLRLK